METLASQSKQELLALILQLRSLVQEQAEALTLARHEIADLKQEIAQLKKGGPGQKMPPPDWLKLPIPQKCTITQISPK